MNLGHTKVTIQAPTFLKLVRQKMFYLTAKTCINTNEAELYRSHENNEHIKYKGENYGF